MSMSGLVTGASLKEFFKTVLEEVIGRQQVVVAELTGFYLVNLLTEFATTDKLFTQEEGGRRDHEPLAMLYHRALQQEREERIRTFRRLGDVSLYKAGFFAGSLNSSAVGPDYYIQMGGTAYGQLADMAPGAGFAEVYRELCSKFRVLVEVLEEIAARGMVQGGPSGTLKVYETWVRTGSNRLERVLVDAGMLVPKGHLSN
ncbi:hypothetical protein SAMN05443639_107127 [Stigmatella erecta]|uniref:Uncharacterized protein n=2 Tax=Stigmatella erecta TaxID=83460 RepID=A0A1I0JBL9_9BACT|nr:hypothetical protein SAMN05443639_107127 [Stigmatella erecta]